MQVTLTIPDELAAELIAAGKDPSRTALEALTDYQRLHDLIDEAETREGIRRGLEDVAAGRTRPAREVFDELRAKYRIPR
jgi:predicted transcriptional regulator